jgi:hypothetical protein
MYITCALHKKSEMSGGTESPSRSDLRSKEFLKKDHCACVTCCSMMLTNFSIVCVTLKQSGQTGLVNAGVLWILESR